MVTSAMPMAGRKFSTRRSPDRSKRDILRFFRADAAYAVPAIDARREDTGHYFAIRLPAIAMLREKNVCMLTRLVGCPSLTKVKRFYRPSRGIPAHHLVEHAPNPKFPTELKGLRRGYDCTGRSLRY